MNKNKKWRNAGLYALLAIVVIALGTAFLEQPSTKPDSWKYSEFINKVETGAIEKVELSADRSEAIVTDQDGTRVLVNLPYDPKLIDILTENNVDIAVKPQSDEGLWFRILSSLYCPQSRPSR